MKKDQNISNVLIYILILLKDDIYKYKSYSSALNNHTKMRACFNYYDVVGIPKIAFERNIGVSSGYWQTTVDNNIYRLLIDRQ